MPRGNAISAPAGFDRVGAPDKQAWCLAQHLKGSRFPSNLRPRKEFPGSDHDITPANQVQTSHLQTHSRLKS